MRLILIVAALALTGCDQAATSSPKPMPEQPSMMAVTAVDFMADDGLTVSGRYYRADKPKALILLFHQANSSKDEYAEIAPRLVEAGYAALAIDQRSGGAMFGKNETAARMPQGADYASAIHDLQGALNWADSMSLPVIVWGSSYSSSLVFQLAAKNPGKVAALLSFSPGEYLGDGKPVEAAAAKIKVPVFVSFANNAEERTAARAVFEAVPAQKKLLANPSAGGVHGSSTLIASRNAAGSAAMWKQVLTFLDSVARSEP
jgi:dienelactone hydrolase